MITITRSLEFDAAHRVMNHESKCATLHGHRYKIQVVATAEQLDSIGRVIDFSVIKEKLGTWLDENWDHTAIFCRADEKTREGFKMMEGKKCAYLLDNNPTAENMADYLLNKICPELFKDTGVTVLEVIVHETPNCFASAKL